MPKVPISVVILAKNEEARIGDCIRSVSGWADEILVIDDESADKTADAARGLGAKVLTRKMDIEGRHRNWAQSQARNEWVFILDADERMTEELKKEIEETLFLDPEVSVYIIPRKNFIGDYWIRGGGLYPAPQMKLFRKDKFKWEEEADVHPRSIMLWGRRRFVKGHILHYTYRDWADFMNKLNRQTTLEAIKWHRLLLEDPKKARYKMNTAHALWRSLDRFIRAFVGKKGYRDGFIGVMIAYFSSLYQIVSYVKYRELEKAGLLKRNGRCVCDAT